MEVQKTYQNPLWFLRGTCQDQIFIKYESRSQAGRKKEAFTGNKVNHLVCEVLRKYLEEEALTKVTYSQAICLADCYDSILIGKDFYIKDYCVYSGNLHSNADWGRYS